MEKIVTYFQFLEEQYGVHITIKDFAHAMFHNPHFSALRKFETHTNNYCMYIKSVPTAWAHCSEGSNIELYHKISCAKNPKEPFWGTCYCGVKEYVIPIIGNHIVLGAILVGHFPCEISRRNSTFDRIAELYDYDRRYLEMHYNESFSGVAIPHEAILASLQVCADHIAFQLSEFFDFRKPREPGSNQTLINTAITYIHANVTKGKVTLADIAQHCHCSESTLSHCFRSSMGMSIGKYVLLRRISKAKKLLATGSLSISTISEKCGFGSTEHFSNAFKHQMGVSPANYRHQLQEKSNEKM